ncbi:Crp/Fnr family transcriptional regulator [Pedobacter sp. L105]|uniref:Crp/Fnr family transcriptional regulator n=1 Tax=Pedobacter sp. L105 TaxID=1641871 RepID=UPI00131D7975|nr:Crp/Fnr family transcriptional regulator [Pedobacter sp. L105]
MINEEILRNIKKHISLTEKETSFFISLITAKSLSKKALVLEAGQDCRYLSYVATGALRSYYTDKDGKESTIMFAIADWWITDMYCYLNKKPAMMNIETLEQSTIFQISRTNFDELLEKVPKFEKFFRILMQNAYTREQLRVMENLSSTAEERYQSFLIKYPQIVKQVTQKQIASYLGITPEFLSTLRKPKV